MKLQHAAMIAGAGVVAIGASSHVPGQTRLYLKVGGFIAVGVGLAALIDSIGEQGGLSGVLGGILDRPKVEPVTDGTLDPEPVVNPGAAPAVEFLKLEGRILSPVEDQVLHARKQLVVDGTYPVELVLENNRATTVEGFLQLRAVEETIFGPVVQSQLATPPITLPPRSFQRLAVNMPCASGRFSVAVNIALSVAFVQNDGRERLIGPLHTPFVLS